MTIKLERREMAQEGIAFVVVPHDTVDSDELYEKVYAVAIGACGMRAVRADRAWSDGLGFDSCWLDALWHGLQSAEVVVVDCSVSCVDAGVALGLSMALGKRLIMTARHAGAGQHGQLRPLLYQAGDAGAAELARALERELRSVRTESGIENTLVPVRASAPGRVISVEPGSAVVETEDGREIVRLRGADVSFTKRVTDLSRVFAPDDRLSGAICTDLTGKRSYSLLAGKRNPWPVIETEYPVGRVFSGRVTDAIEGKGALVPLMHGVCGHLPADEVRQENLRRYDDVRVRVTSVDADARLVGLGFIGRCESSCRRTQETPVPKAVLKPASRSVEALELPEPGQRLRGWVVRLGKHRDCVLVELEGYELRRPAILPAWRMLPELRGSFRSGKVQLDAEVFVQVARVRRRHGDWDVELREVGQAGQGGLVEAALAA